MTIKELLDNWKKEHGLEDEDAHNVLIAFVEHIGSNEEMLDTLSAMFPYVTIGDFLAQYLKEQLVELHGDEDDNIDEDSSYLANLLP